MRKLFSAFLAAGLLFILGCGGGGSFERDLTELQGTWVQKGVYTGQVECDGEVEPFYMEYEMVYTISPSKIQPSDNSLVYWNWTGSDLTLDWTFSVSMGPDPDCGIQVMTYGWHYRVSFNQNQTAGTITGSVDYSMKDDCMDCTAHLDLTGSWEKL